MFMEATPFPFHRPPLSDLGGKVYSISCYIFQKFESAFWTFNILSLFQFLE